MRVAGFVQVDRKDSQRAHEALAAAGAQMRTDQVSLVIAPEGTRTRTGQLLPFRKGAFSLSQTTGIPILPVAVDGTIRVHKSGELKVHRGQTVTVKILQPLWPGDYATVEDFRDAGQRMIQQALSLEFQSQKA
jgi:1-acyl-sn-glycerol-3-phosphate acyltransferase